MYIQVSSALEEQIQSAVEMKDAAESRIVSLLSAQSKLTSTIQQQKSELAILKHNNASLEKQLAASFAQLKSEKNILDKKIGELRAENDIKIQRQLGVNEHLEREISALQTRLKSTSEDLKAARNDLFLERRKNVESSNNSTKTSALHQNLQDLTSENMKLRKQVEEQLVAMSGLKVAGESSVSSMLAAQQTMEKSITEQSDEIMRQASAISNLQKQLQVVTFQKESAEKRAASMLASQEEQQGTIETLHEQKQQLIDQIHGLRGQMETNTRQDTASSARVAVLLAEQQLHQQVASAQMRKTCDLDSATETLEVQLRQLHCEMQRWGAGRRAEADALRHQALTFSERHTEARALCAAAEARAAACLQANDRLEREVREWRGRAEAQEERLRAAAGLREASEGSVATLLAVQEQVRSAAESQSQQLQALFARAETLEERLQAATAARDAAEARAAALAAARESSAVFAGLQTALAESIVGQAEHVDAQLASALGACRALCARLARSKEEAAAMQNAGRAREAEVAGLRDRCTDLERRLEQASSQLTDEAQNLGQRNLDLEGALRALSERSAAAAASHAAEVDSLQQSFAAAVAALEEAAAERERLEAQLATAARAKGKTRMDANRFKGVIAAGHWKGHCIRRSWKLWRDCAYASLIVRKFECRVLSRQSRMYLAASLKVWVDHTHSFRTERMKVETEAMNGRIMQSLKEQRFAAVASELSKMEKPDSNLIDAAVQQIRNLVEELRRKAIKISEDLSCTEMQELYDEYKGVREVRSVLGPFVNWTENGLDQAVENALRAISSKIVKHIQRIEHALERADIPKCEALLSRIQTVLDIGEDFFSTIISFDKVSELQDAINLRFDAKVERILSMNVQDYSAEPPLTFFNFFEKSRQDGDLLVEEKYQSKLDRLKAALYTKFSNALIQARSQTDMHDSTLADIQEAFNFLPTELRSSLEAKLKQTKDEIQSNQREEFGRLEAELQSWDSGAVQARLQSRKQSHAQQVRERVAEHVRAQFQTLLDGMGEEAGGALSRRCTEMAVIFRFGQCLTADVPPLSSILREARDRLSHCGVQACAFVKDHLFTADDSASTAAAEKTERAYEVATAIRSLAAELNALNLPPEISLQGHLQAFDKLQEAAMRSYSEIRAAFEQAVDALDWPGVSATLTRIRPWDRFLLQAAAGPEWQGPRDPARGGAAPLRAYGGMLEAARLALARCVESLQGAELINESTSLQHEPRARDDFYRALGQRLDAAAAGAGLLREHLPALSHVTAGHLYEACLRPQALALFAEARRLCDPPAAGGGAVDFGRFNLVHANLDALRRCLRPDVEAGFRLEELSDAILAGVERRRERLLRPEQVADIDLVARGLLELKALANGLYCLTQEINARIDAALQQYKAALGGNMAVAKLATVLSRMGHVGQDLIQEHACFVGYQIHLFNGKTQQQDIHYVLKHLRGDGVRADALRRLHAEFEEAYRGLVERYLHPDPKNFEELAALAVELAARHRDPPPRPAAAGGGGCALAWDEGKARAVPALCAHIFALWTVHFSASFFGSSDAQSRDSYLLRPHAAQVVAVFRLFGLDAPGAAALDRHLVQIGTGEGKSVTLAVAACVLALLGAEVSAACYSEYLSRRDHEAFLFLFRALRVEGAVRYGTFNALCEMEINEGGDIREVAERLIRGGAAQEPPPAGGGAGAAARRGGGAAGGAAGGRRRYRVLLIDEVDVFFSDRFYGSVYTPSCCVADPAVARLILALWERRADPALRLRAAQEWPEYAACCRALPGWEPLVDAALAAMLEDLAAGDEGPEYVVQGDLIGYKEQDGLAFNVTYGYRTLFAYLREWGRGRISDAGLERHLALRVRCGCFSYAEVPKHFDAVVGLTGTLATLSAAEDAVVRGEYGIAKRTYVPSVFGASSLAFRPEADVRVEPDEGHHLALAAEAAEQARRGRAVLVFFSSKAALGECLASAPFAGLRGEALVLTEETPLREKGALIKRATTAGTVALLTRDYGRGTDFVCRDPAVAAAGGVHVVQAFLSAEVAEETQIRGRTARQGDRGSYVLVAREGELAAFGVTPAEAADARARGALAALLRERRAARFEASYAQATAQVRALEAL
jgi:hypothetical protein